MSLRLHPLAVFGFCALAVAGCAGSATTSTTSPTGTPAAPAAVVASMPLVSATSAPATLEGQVAAACSGAPVSGAVPYGGSVHPLYVVTGGDVQRADQQRYSFDSDHDKADWLKAEWSSPLQLVVCPAGQERLKIESCGDYRNNYGQSYEVVRYRLVKTVTVVAAATGKTFRTDKLPGSDPAPCTQTVQSFDLVGGPPDVYEYALKLAGG